MGIGDLGTSAHWLKGDHDADDLQRLQSIARTGWASHGGEDAHLQYAAPSYP